MSVFCGDRHSAIAPAKINLTLRVLGRRADGYHDLESVVAKVTLYDGIDLVSEDDPAIQIECTNPAVPTDTQNTIWRAIELLSNRAGPLPPMRVQLHKRIPLGAGLGGGSSDAAAVLMLLSRRLDGRVSDSDLAHIAAEVGSDVCCFLQPHTVYISGRGEIVRPVELPWRGWAVLVFPPFGVSTAAVYAAWQANGSAPDRDAEICLKDTCNTAEKLDEVLFNDLENSVFAVEPRMREAREHVEDVAQQRFHVTGSGSTLFACLDSHEQAEQLKQRIDLLSGLKSLVTRVITSEDNK
ncbi:MAG: 4-(cytidine 5'-diphospho)-2-C-methyl-D-erythritol kinase [Planctomycetes bacterium]|nr:4-(cytidine 5'-diphospho)-2-C-methyl-D-erythritol kinase [Planctomycetota bacterium]